MCIWLSFDRRNNAESETWTAQTEKSARWRKLRYWNHDQFCINEQSENLKGASFFFLKLFWAVVKPKNTFTVNGTKQ